MSKLTSKRKAPGSRNLPGASASVRQKDGIQMRGHVKSKTDPYSIHEILNRELCTYTRGRVRVTGRGIDFVEEVRGRLGSSPFYFVDKDQLRELGKRMAAHGGRALLNERFGDLIDEHVCVGDEWNGIAGFYR